MLSGEYILHEPVYVFNVVSLFIYGSRSEVNRSARENQVVINCEYRGGGIGFKAVANLFLSRLTMVKCGIQLVHRGIHGGGLRFSYFGLYIFAGFNVNLSYLFITNSTQIGLLCINTRGNSGIHDSEFTHSNYRMLEKYMHEEVECSAHGWECHGSNVWVLFLKPFLTFPFNTSNFIVERTTISYGVNLITIPNGNPFRSGAGIAVRVDPEVGYDVQITITKCYFMNNIGKITAHLHLVIFGSCSVLVKGSNFTYANRLSEGMPMELVPVVHPDIGALTFTVDDGNTAALDVEIVMNEIHIAENVGCSMRISLYPQLSQSHAHVRLSKIKVVHNILVIGHFGGHLPVVRIEDDRENAGGVYTSLELVEISNNVLVFNTRKQNLYLFGTTACALSLAHTAVHFKQTRFFNNSIPAMVLYNSYLHFHGINVFRNNTGGQCGLVLYVDSQIHLHRSTQVYILDNSALKYGGGICVDDGSVSQISKLCFYQIVDLDVLNNNATYVYMARNTASITGYAIYAGCVQNCISSITNSPEPSDPHKLSHKIFSHVFRFGFLNISLGFRYQVSSRSITVCFCYPGPALICDETIMPSIYVYPGQTFKISAVGNGSGISPAVVRSRINSKYDIIPELQSLGNACEPLNYTIMAPEDMAGILVQLRVEGSSLIYGSIKYLNLTTLKCPQGFILQHFKCKCHRMLKQASVQCDINTQRFTRSGSVWVGVGSEEGLLTHMHCPNEYCKLQETDFNLTSPDAQCAFGHSGVLCGGCESGLALILGSSKCQHCSNIYLLLILPFLAAGVLLVLILGRLDITVASGTMNGVLFYANVVKVSSDALISNSVSKYFIILSAWLNLDLGIETCFSNHLDMFWKVLLQFAFPSTSGYWLLASFS